MRRETLLLALGCGLLAAGCTSSGDDLPRAAISSSQYGERWPLTVDAATFVCDTSGEYGEGFKALFLEVGDDLYAVNGTARGGAYPPIDQLYKGDPLSLDGPYMQVTELVGIGNSLTCDA